MKELAMLVFFEDIFREILLRLPVKSLLRFKTVCKTWYSIINCTAFVRDHLKLAHAARYNQHKNFIGILDAVFFKEDSDGLMLAKEFDFLIENHVEYEEEVSTWACNSCDGLICFQNNHPNDVAIWNPSFPTEYRVINLYFSGSCAIGYDPRTDDYKIVRVPYYFADKIACIEVQLFSLKGDSLRTVRITKTMDYKIVNTKVIYTKNRLHWLGRDLRYKEIGDETFFVVYFDMVEESLDYLNLPSSSDKHVVPLNYKESLAIVCPIYDGEGDIWVLQEYCGMKSSWNKILTISCTHGPPLDYCFTLKGELLLCCEMMGFFILDAKDGSLKDVESEGGYHGEVYQCFFTSPYVESLISLRRLQ